MNRIIICALVVFSSSIAQAKEIKYDPTAAAQYAKDNAFTYNPTIYICYGSDDWNDQRPTDCEDSGTDCANFMSQALIAGGIDMAKNTARHCFWNTKGPDKSKNHEYVLCGEMRMIWGQHPISQDQKVHGFINALDFGIVIEKSFCFKKLDHVSEAVNGDIVGLKTSAGCTKHVGMVTDAANRL